MATLEDNTVYMTLNTRGIPGAFHFGVFMTSSAPSGDYYHASNLSGGWELKVHSTLDPLASLTLVILYKIGKTGSVSSRTAADQVLRAQPANGTASLRTGEAFDCRIWVKDAIMALHNEGIVTLQASIDTLEREALAAATRLEPRIETGAGRAAVL